MKRLVVSLLRLGDIVLATPAIHALKSKHPDDEIHLLVNSEFHGLVPLLKDVSKVHFFDRKNIQEGLVNSNRPLFEPYDRLNKMIDELNAEEFDQIINLTHNRLSGWLCSLIDCPERNGLSLDVQGRPMFGSAWFDYLNKHIGGGGDEVFHFADIYSFGAGLIESTNQIVLKETKNGKRECLELLGQASNYLAVQPLTSDTKKDWGIDNFVISLKNFSESQTGCDIVLLGAPFEKDKLIQLQERLSANGVKSTLAICSLEAAFSILKKAKLLLTGDTSIKHMACAADCKIIEICLGSSDYRKTGTYRPGNLILQGKIKCAPCSHYDDCSQPSHFCSEKISPKLVGGLLLALNSRNKEDLSHLAKTYESETHVLESVIGRLGFWHVLPIQKSHVQDLAKSLLDLSSRKLCINGEHQNRLGSYGSESIHLREELRPFVIKGKEKDWFQIIKHEEDKSRSTEEDVERQIAKLNALVKQQGKAVYFEELVSSLEVFVNKQGKVPELDELLEEGKAGVSAENQFLWIRKMQRVLFELKNRNLIRSRLARSLKTQVMEIT